LRQGRGTALAIALLSAALASVGCGVGPGSDVGEVSLTVTRDYGAELLQPASHDKASESDTVMRVLERSAEISTRYGGGFVSSIDGLTETAREGHRYDWFFYVNGVESPVGAADFSLHGGESIWWDYRNWSAASRVPAVVGSWPQPLTHGYEGRGHPVVMECDGGGPACDEVRSRLEEAGVALAQNGTSEAIRVLVGPWRQLRQDPAAAQIDDGPEVSGVFAGFAQKGGRLVLQGLDEAAEPVLNLGPGGGLVAATRRYGAPPVWLVTGATTDGVRAAAGLLGAAQLRDHYAVATEGGQEIPLPVAPQ
jgi:Domain of unknown function (DUF4430)